MYAIGRWMLLTCLVGVSSTWASPLPDPGAEEGPMSPSGSELLDRLKSQSLVLVPVAATEVGPVSGKACAWYSVVIGERGEDGGWAQIGDVFHMESDVQFETALGPMELSWRTIRPHLEPTWEKRVASAEDLVPTMDPGLRQMLAARLEDGPFTLSESCLIAGKAIAAQVDIESYMLPPSPPDFEPSEGSKTVLRVSNGPWKEGRPVLGLTPPFDGWSY